MHILQFCILFEASELDLDFHSFSVMTMLKVASCADVDPNLAALSAPMTVMLVCGTLLASSARCTVAVYGTVDARRLLPGLLGYCPGI